MDAKKKEPSLRDVAKFLLGEGELNGCWFGEKPEAERGNYWWRTYLRAALAQPAQGEVDKDDAWDSNAERIFTEELTGVVGRINPEATCIDDIFTFDAAPQPPADTIAVPASEYEAMKAKADAMDEFLHQVSDAVVKGSSSVEPLGLLQPIAKSTGEDV